MCGKSRREETLSWGAEMGGRTLGQTFAAVDRPPPAVSGTLGLRQTRYIILLHAAFLINCSKKV